MDLQDLVPRIPDIEYMDDLFSLDDLSRIVMLFFDLYPRAFRFLGRERATACSARRCYQYHEQYNFLHAPFYSISVFCKTIMHPESL